MRINRIKRLLCSVMTVFIMLSVIPNVLASEAQSAKSLENKEVESESIGLLRSLGIIENEELNTKITRGEFAVYAGKCLGIQSQNGSDKRYFKDVDPNSREAMYIHPLYEMGIINGAGDGTFETNEYISATSAQIIMLRIAGYGAIVKNDAEYSKYIARYSLSKGVSNGEITGTDAAEIIFNALNMPVCVVKSFGTNPEYKIDYEYLLSEKLFDVYKESGLIRGADGISLDKSISLSQDEALIDDIRYDVIGDTAAKMYYDIGKRADVYIKKVNNDVDCIYYYTCYNETSDVEFGLDDIVGEVQKDLNIAYDENNRTKRIQLPKNVIIIKNGKLFSDEPYLAFKEKQGLVRVNKTESETIVTINVYDSVYVSGVDTKEKKIYAKHGKTVSADADKLERLRIYLADGSIGTINDIKKGMLITVFRSEVSVEVRVSTNVKEAALIQINNEKVSLDGDEYTVEPEYSDEFKNSISVGMKANFYFNIYGEIAYMSETDSSDIAVGFLKNAVRSDDFGDKISVKIFTSDGEMKVFENDERVKINGVKMKAEDAVNTLKAENGGFVSQIITYKTDKDGKISCIYTADNPDGTLRKTADTKNRKWYATARMMLPDVVLKTSGTIFKVPTIASAETADDKKFRVLKNIDNSNSWKCSAYSTSDDGFYSDVVLVEADKVLGSIDWSSYPMMVNGVSEQLNEDGETVKVVSLGGTTSDYISDKGIRIFEFSDDFEVISGEPYPVDYPGKKCVDKDDISEGDIIFCAYDQDKKITHMLMFYDYDNPAFGISDIAKYKINYGSDARFVAGYAVEKDDAIVGLSTVAPNGKIDEFAHFHGYEAVPIIVYDDSLRENKMYEGTINDVLTYDDAGENASVVIPFTFAGWAKEFMIYKNGLK